MRAACWQRSASRNLHWLKTAVVTDCSYSQCGDGQLTGCSPPCLCGGLCCAAASGALARMLLAAAEGEALLPVYCEKVRAVLRGCCWLMACWLVLSSRLLLLLQLRYQ